MELDVRLPMGAMFVLLGGVLTAYGLATLHSPYASSLGINVNLWWGLVILLFGILMLLLAWRSRIKARSMPPIAHPTEGEPPRSH
jgi:membrane protein implicated in regulation of membrane protease activity